MNSALIKARTGGDVQLGRPVIAGERRRLVVVVQTYYIALCKLNQAKTSIQMALDRGRAYTVTCSLGTKGYHHSISYYVKTGNHRGTAAPAPLY